MFLRCMNSDLLPSSLAYTFLFFQKNKNDGNLVGMFLRYLNIVLLPSSLAYTFLVLKKN